MKKIFYKSCVIAFLFSSCKGFDGTITAPPACDNTVNNCFISLDFSQTFYYCNSGAYAVQKPPLATGSNYLYAKSATNDIVNITDNNAYLCQINVKNDQPAQTACTSPGVLKLYWINAGVNQQVSTFSHFASDMTVDYYDPVDICATGRPYFIGKTGLPAGVTSWTPIPMFTQPNYKK